MIREAHGQSSMERLPSFLVPTSVVALEKENCNAQNIRFGERYHAWWLGH